MSYHNKPAVEILSTVAGLFFAMAIWVWRKERVVRRWPKVSGTIISSTTRRKRMGRFNGEEVFPVIKYEFLVRGLPISTDHWRVANFSLGAGDATGVMSRYPVGASVDVFVNEQDPKKSVLECTHSSLPMVLAAFGIFCCALSLLAVRG